MFIVFGHRFFGRVDEVPGFFHVATKFFHLWYIPLVPVKSVVIIGRDKKSVAGVAAPLSMKSIFMAWLQAALVGLCIVAAIAGLSVAILQPSGARHVDWSRVAGGVAIALIGAVPAVLAWWVQRIRGLGRASYERAVRIAEKIGMTEEGLVHLEVAFGRVTHEEAQETLHRLAEIDAEHRAALHAPSQDNPA